jgi:hypothetical protein
MFENPGCIWEFGLINRPAFPSYNQDHSTFSLIRQLAEIRFQNQLIHNGTRTLICSRNNGLWCVLIHDRHDSQPLFIAMNLGPTTIVEEALKIPDWYGDLCGADMLVSTSGGVFNFVEGGMRIKLTPFTFVLGRLSAK